jgi:hypothetical protein
VKRLPWILWGTAVALTLATFGLLAFAGGSAEGELQPAFDAVVALALLSYPTVGALVASRHPGNAIGWLFCAIGLPFGVSAVTFAYGATGLPGDEIASWVNAWIFLPPLFGVPALLFLLFPDGRLLGRRWRAVVWLTAVAMVGFAAAPALRPGVMEDAPVEGFENPLGIPGTAGLFDAVSAISGSFALLAIVLASVSLALRFRRSHGVERLQLKWFVSAAALFAGVCVAFVSVPFPSEAIGQLAILATYVLIPVAAGIAILRHRLYDIDLVIRRALVYGALTATLAGTYLAVALLIGLAVGRSDLAVAASTLAVAGAFGPARGRIQAVVDRRFYRRRYDATLTLEAFGGRLRDELDLEALGADLRGVVRDTVQPAHVSLWLRRPS